MDNLVTLTQLFSSKDGVVGILTTALIICLYWINKLYNQNRDDRKSYDENRETHESQILDIINRYSTSQITLNDTIMALLDVLKELKN